MEEKKQNKTFRKISVVPKAEVPQVKVTDFTGAWDTVSKYLLLVLLWSELGAKHIAHLDS